MVTLLFLPNGGLASTMSYSPCFPANASCLAKLVHDAELIGKQEVVFRRVQRKTIARLSLTPRKSCRRSYP
jgi:hypothetical protein